MAFQSKHTIFLKNVNKGIPIMSPSIPNMSQCQPKISTCQLNLPLTCIKMEVTIMNSHHKLFNGWGDATYFFHCR